MRLLPVYENPALEHKRLDEQIRVALTVVGISEALLNAYVYGRFETVTPWHDHTIATKELILEYLQKKLQETRGAQTA